MKKILAVVVMAILMVGCLWTSADWSALIEEDDPEPCVAGYEYPGQVIGNHYMTAFKTPNVEWSEYTTYTCSFKFLHDYGDQWGEVVFTEDPSLRIGNAMYVLDTSYYVGECMFYQYKQVREIYRGVLNNYGICDFDNQNPNYDFMMRFEDLEGLADTLYIQGL